MYQDNEDLLGAWFKRNPGKRDNIFLATKFANYVDPTTGERSIRNEPAYVEEAMARSLARLGVDHVDLYYCHRLDPSQPIETTVAAMQRLRAAGKARHLGLSECSAESLRRACAVAHIDAVQIEYSAFSLDVESEQVGLLAACRELGVATVAYSPLGRGFLTGGLRSRADLPEGDWRLAAPRFAEANFARNLELVDALRAKAAQKGCSAGQLALAWLLAQGGDVIPIPGTTRIANFDENVAALKVHVSKEDDEEIRAAIAKTEVAGERYPESFMASCFVTTRPL